MAAMSRPRELTAREKVKASMAKNCLIVTLMSLELGYGSILECYQQESKSILERYQQEPPPEGKREGRKSRGRTSGPVKRGKRRYTKVVCMSRV